MGLGAAVGLIALQRGPPVCKASLREGSMDFITIVPRIALGVIGSGYIAAVIPQEFITGWLGPDSGWFGVAAAVIAGAATPGGPVVGLFHRRGGLKSGRWRAAGDRLCRRLGAVCLPAADLWEIPFMLARFVWFRWWFRCRSRWVRGHRHGYRQALSPSWTEVML